MKLRNRVAELLEELGWTPSRLSNNTGLGRATAYKLKNDPYYLGDGRALSRISTHLGIPIYDLIAIERETSDRRMLLRDNQIKGAVERMRDKKQTNCLPMNYFLDAN